MQAAIFGSTAMWSAIAAAGLAGILGIRRSTARWAPIALGAAATLAGVACLVLAWALVSTDLSLSYVARTTSRATPWPYRMAALWGGNEGSLLFFATLTLLFGALGTRRSPRAAAVTALVGGGYLAMGAVLASPFATPPIPPVDGAGLLAILQHPAMIYHPPILYAGLTTLVVPYTLVVTASSFDRDLVPRLRRWLTVSWTLLTIGMAAGGNWAYVELGWGGFWAWDPVENTSLMPWLAITAFLHLSRVTDGRLVRTTATLAMAPFVLSVVGVYLTRSGVTGSVHAFADSPTMGGILIVAAGLIIVWTARAVTRLERGSPLPRFTPLRRDTWLSASAGLLLLALTTVTIGSLWPAWSYLVLDRQLAVAPIYFVTTTMPIAFALAGGSALALDQRWSSSSPTRLFPLFAGLGMGIFGAATWLAPSTGLAARALLATAVAAAAASTVSAVRRRPSLRRLPAHLAHIGFAIVLIGAAGSALGDEFRGAVGVGETVTVGPYDVTVTEISTGEADRYIYVRADVDVRADGRLVTTMAPEIRAYEAQALPVPEPVLRSTVTSDLVVAISRVTGDAGLVQLSVFRKPLVLWVWVGASILSMAGVLATLGRSADDGARRRMATTGRPAGPSTIED